MQIRSFIYQRFWSVIAIAIGIAGCKKSSSLQMSKEAFDYTSAVSLRDAAFSQLDLGANDCQRALTNPSIGFWIASFSDLKNYFENAGKIIYQETETNGTIKGYGGEFVWFGEKKVSPYLKTLDIKNLLSSAGYDEIDFLSRRVDKAVRKCLPMEESRKLKFEVVQVRFSLNSYPDINLTPHADPNYLRATVSVVGPGTAVFKTANAKEFRGLEHEDEFKKLAASREDIRYAEVGELVIFSGLARAALLKEPQLATFHRQPFPASYENMKKRIVFLFTWERAPL